MVLLNDKIIMYCMENFNDKSPRQKQVEYLQELMIKVKNAPVDKEGLIHPLCEFVNYCNNLKIINGFSGSHLGNITFDSNLKNELLSNIEMAIAVAETRQTPIGSSLIVNNNNQQSQNLNDSVITEALRKSLTGEQYDEMIEMIKSKSDKKTIKEKLLSFGSDTLAGIISAIISGLLIK